MPQYTYDCAKCNETFTMYLPMDKFVGEYRCPECDTLAPHSFLEDAKTISSNVRKGDDEITVGALAKRNSERLSSDEKAHLTYEQNKYKYEEPTKELPKGMSRMGKPKDRHVTKKQRKKDPKRGKNRG